MLKTYLLFADDLVTKQDKQTDIKKNISVLINDDVKCDVAPCKLAFDTTNMVMSLVSNNLSLTNKQITNLSHNFDFQLITKFAMGKNWKNATVEQQNQLIALFRKLLIYTYSAALDKFKDATITIINVKIDSKKDTDKQTASVLNTVALNDSADNQTIKVEYNLANTGVNNTWLFYDIKIADASLVSTYRNQFNDIIQSSGINGLIQQLESKVDNLKKINNKKNNHD